VKRLVSRASGILTLIAVIIVGGCQSLDAPVLSIPDARNNLTGDSTLAFLDIVESSVHREGDFFAFTVKTAAPAPGAELMAGGRRVDFIWFVDADKNQTTGQTESGNDFNLHLWLDQNGWHEAVYPVSDIAIGRKAPTNPSGLSNRVTNESIVLLVPVSTFPEAEFEWWAKSTTMNSPDWQPVTENPATRRASTETLRAGSISPTL